MWKEHGAFQIAGWHVLVEAHGWNIVRLIHRNRNVDLSISHDKAMI